MDKWTVGMDLEMLETGIRRGSVLIMDSAGLDTGFLKELDVIKTGPSHKWWLSARLLLGMKEVEARRLHETMNSQG